MEDKENWPHVTTILELLPNPKMMEWRLKTGKAKANSIARKAAKVGTALHVQIRPTIGQGARYPLPEPPKKKEKVEPELLALWGKWYERNPQLKVVAVENTLYNYRLKVQGTPDVVCEDEVVDWKVTTAVRTKYLWQVAAYALMAQEAYGLTIQRARVVRFDVLLNQFEEALVDREELVELGYAFEDLAKFYHKYKALPERVRE